VQETVVLLSLSLVAVAVVEQTNSGGSIYDISDGSCGSGSSSNAFNYP
jgi:hypothetical protein